MELQLIALVFPIGVAAALGWLFWRTARFARSETRMAFFERELCRQTEQSRALSGVVKRHVQQSLEARQQVRQVQRQLEALRRQALEGRTCDNAIARVRRGKDINPLVTSGELNSAEAHLIRMVHSSQPRTAQQRPAITL